jgi:hypothetical protein
MIKLWHSIQKAGRNGKPANCGNHWNRNNDEFDRAVEAETSAALMVCTGA